MGKGRIEGYEERDRKENKGKWEYKLQSKRQSLKES